VIQTAELLLAGRAVRDLLAARAMGVLHGPAGSGKTFAAHVALGELRVATAWVQFPSRPSMLPVARRLYRELAGADPRRANRFDLSEELIALLAGSEWLLIVDEAQWLNRECIEYLRHLHDHPETLFALLLIGGDGCWEVLSREPMLRSRICRRVRFTRLPPALPPRRARVVGARRRPLRARLLPRMGELHPQRPRAVPRAARIRAHRRDRTRGARAARRRQPRGGGVVPRVRLVRDPSDANGRSIAYWPPPRGSKRAWTTPGKHSSATATTRSRYAPAPTSSHPARRAAASAKRPDRPTPRLPACSTAS